MESSLALWDVDECDRFVKLALFDESLLSYREQIFWKFIQVQGDPGLRARDEKKIDWRHLREIWGQAGGTAKAAGMIWMKREMKRTMARAFERITRSSMRSLEPGAKLNENGISFARMKNGEGVFSVNVMVDGQRIHRVIGNESDGVVRGHAEQFIAKVRTEARGGRLSLPRGRKTQTSFAQAAKQYEARLAETGGKNMVVKRRHFSRYLNPFFGAYRLDSISSFSVDRYKLKRLDAGASNGTVDLELVTLSHLMNCAIEWGWIKMRPCKIRLLEREQGRIIALTDEQAEALFQGALADDDPSCWLFVAFGLKTAMRHREILRSRFRASRS